MTDEEMRIVIRGAMQADGGECIHCAELVVASVARALPAPAWQDVWREVVNGEFGFEAGGFDESAQGWRAQ